MHSKIKQIAMDNPDVLWCKLNGSDPSLTGIFEAMEIKKVPYFHMVLDGELAREMTCSLSPEKLSLFRSELAAMRKGAHALQRQLALEAGSAASHDEVVQDQVSEEEEEAAELVGVQAVPSRAF